MKTSTRIIDYYFKCCIVGQKYKNNTSGRKRRKSGFQVPPTYLHLEVDLGVDYY